MSFIQIENLNFIYPDAVVPVFTDLNLRLDTEWKLGLVGRNGKGKTTLLNLLCGKLKGEGRISANLPFRYFPCAVSDIRKTAYELVEEIAPDTQLWEIQREISLLGLDDEILFRPFETLSGGERTKFMLAVLFACEGFPLLDEPTDHVDLEGRKQLAKYLSAKKGFLVVSHDRAFLDGCCDHILALTNTGAELVRGNYSVWRTERNKKEENERGRRETLEKERMRLGKSVLTMRAWADKSEQGKFRSGKADSSPIDRGFVGARAAKLQKRAGAVIARREKAAENIKELLKSIEETETLKLFPQPFRKTELLRIENVAVSFSEKPVFSGLNLTVSAGERIAVTGKNGAGKSVFLKLVTGEIAGCEGERYIPSGLKISYVPQLFEYSGLLSDYAREYGIDESYFKAILSKFGFDSKDFSRDMRYFSEGQKKKAALARSLCERAHLYIWDEPLNYLDITAREQLTDAVLASDISLLFVEHDLKFTEEIATRRLTLE